VSRYRAGQGPLQTGSFWGKLTLENVRFTDLSKSALAIAPSDVTFTVEQKNVSYSFGEGAETETVYDIPEGSAVNVIGE
jgi:hypothetical protein